MRSITIILIAILGVLQYRLWFGRASLPEVKQFEELRLSREKENQSLLDRNNTLAAEVQDLKKGKQSVEERARSEMGMIQKTETFYQIVEQPEQSVTPQ